MLYIVFRLLRAMCIPQRLAFSFSLSLSPITHTHTAGSGTVYPSATPFIENSNVGICMLLPADLEQGAVVLDLEQFFWRYSFNLLNWYTSTNTGAFFPNFFVLGARLMSRSQASAGARWCEVTRRRRSLRLCSRTRQRQAIR
jgi:hypothetical protein